MGRYSVIIYNSTEEIFDEVYAAGMCFEFNDIDAALCFVQQCIEIHGKVAIISNETEQKCEVDKKSKEE